MVMESKIKQEELKNYLKEHLKMERNVKISLEKAREWYNSGNESLKEVALQAFKKSELMNSWETIKTFEDACRVLNIDPKIVDYLIYDAHLQNIYKLQIVKKALNGADWEPKLNTGTIYYPWMKYYPKGSGYNSSWTPVANFKAKENGKVYTLVGGDYGFCDGGLGIFGSGYGVASALPELLGCKSIEIARYFGKTFGKLIFDAIRGPYNNYTWV